MQSGPLGLNPGSTPSLPLTSGVTLALSSATPVVRCKSGAGGRLGHAGVGLTRLVDRLKVGGVVRVLGGIKDDSWVASLSKESRIIY